MQEGGAPPNPTPTATLRSGVFHFNGTPGDWLTRTIPLADPPRHHFGIMELYITYSLFICPHWNSDIPVFPFVYCSLLSPRENSMDCSHTVVKPMGIKPLIHRLGNWNEIEWKWRKISTWKLKHLLNCRLYVKRGGNIITRWIYVYLKFSENRWEKSEFTWIELNYWKLFVKPLN